MKLTGKQTWVFENPLFVNAAGTATGPKEKDGPLGSLFDKTYDEMHCNQKNWEMAERQLMEDAINSALQKQNLKKSDIDLLLAGGSFKSKCDRQLRRQTSENSVPLSVRRLFDINGNDCRRIRAH